MDAFGHLKGETVGPVTIARTYYPQTGLAATITAGTGGQSDNVANFSYGDGTNPGSGWDVFGNLLNRTDSIQNYDENFCGIYPPAALCADRGNSLNRLTQYAVSDGGSGTCSSGTIAKTMTYDAGGAGNIASKSDLGTYNYGGAGPHAVSSVTTSSPLYGLTNPFIYYDADGNMTCITTAGSCDGTAARSYGWTSFDPRLRGGKHGRIGCARRATDTAIAYTPEHTRASITTGGVPMYYLNNPAGGISEELVAGSSQSWHTYLAPYGHTVAELETASGTTTPYYFVGDQLGSTTALVEANGTQEEYDSGACPPAALCADRGDAWGKRRYAGGTDAPGCSSSRPRSATTRGFTGEEMLDSYCLVNLNARIYDPTLGRFPTADPTIPDATDGQSYNRYSYVENEPLTFTDPTGYTMGANSCEDPEQADDCHIEGGPGGEGSQGGSGSGGGDAGYCNGDPTCGGNFSWSSDGSTLYYNPDSPNLGPIPLPSLPDLGPGESPDDLCVNAGTCGEDFNGSGLPGGGFTGEPGGGGGGRLAQEVNPHKSTNPQPPKPKSCTAASRAAAGAMAVWHSVDAVITAGGGAAVAWYGSAAFGLGCLNPTPFEPATCFLGTFAAATAWGGALGAIGESGAIVYKEVVPDVKEATCGS